MIKLHPWKVDPEEAVRLQISLRQRLVLTWDDRPVRTVAGVDVDFPGEIARAAIVVLAYPDLTCLEVEIADTPLGFPYIPGLLAFREGPAVLAAWEKLRIKPDLLFFDAQGIAHPRGIGMAAQMGLWLERPAIGVAKSRLYGEHAEVGPKAGEWVELSDEHDPRQVIGAVLRTREKARPLYVSPGHLIDLEHALEFVLRCCRGYRLPEPSRLAHQASRQPGKFTA